MSGPPFRTPASSSERERPAFARDFPRTPDLDRLVDAFARGDYAQVRTDAPKAEQQSDDDAVRAAIRTLVERTKPEPLAVALLSLAAGLLVILFGWWAVHGKAPPGATPAATPVERVTR
jgi:hypothetical protein